MGTKFFRIAMGSDDFSEQREHGFAVLSEGDTMLTAEEYFITELILQCSDHAGDTRLRIIQGFSGSTQASSLDGFKNSLTLIDFHTFSFYEYNHDKHDELKLYSWIR